MIGRNHPGNPLFSYRVGRRMGCGVLRSIYIAWKMAGTGWPILKQPSAPYSAHPTDMPR